MFDKNMEDRLRAWSDFRNNLEDEPDPFKSTIELYNLAPLVTYNIDPDSPMTWPNPWELLNENQYDDLGYILGIGYTLGLTDRFSSSVLHKIKKNPDSIICYMLTIKLLDLIERVLYAKTNYQVHFLSNQYTGFGLTTK